MKMSKLDEVSNFVGDRRADSEAFTSDGEVATAFDDEQRKQGVGQRDRLLGEDESSMSLSDISAGDVDVDEMEASTSGEEAPGGMNPTPGQDRVDDIGRAVGIEYNDDEPLDTNDKLERRDQHRWELDPASAEDYKERHVKR